MRYIVVCIYLCSVADANMGVWAIKSNNIFRNTLKNYVSKVLQTYDVRSLILASHSSKDWFACIHELNTPVYLINLQEVNKFNGPFHGKYDVRITFEESKIYIVMLEELLEIEKALLQVQSVYFWRQRDKVLVLMPLAITAQLKEKLTELFTICWKHKILNLTFIFLGGSVKAVTYIPFRATKSIDLVFLQDSNVFPDKLKDLYGYNVNISMFPNIVDAIPKEEQFVGRDGYMASTVKQILNASFTYIPPKDCADYGENLGRERMTGAFADVANDHTEIAFNSRYLKGEFENILEATYPHGRDDLTCLVPVAKASDIKDFGSNFSPQIWLLLVATQLVLLCLICLLMTITPARYDPILGTVIIFGTFLGQPASESYQNSRSLRVTLLSLTYIAFFFEIAYLSQLASILAVPRKPHQINTLEELAESDLKIYTLFRFKKMLNRTLREPLRQTLTPKLLTYQEDEQVDQLNEHKYIGAICKEHIAMYVVRQKNNFVDGGMFYRIMKEKPMPSIVCYGVKYGSPMLEKLNDIINRLTAAGIPNHWRKSTLEEMSIKGKMYQSADSLDERTLTLRNLTNVFYCLVAGWCISVVVFFMELALSKTHIWWKN